MITNVQPIYQRILLKLSGEVLQGTGNFGIDATVLKRISQEIKELVELNIQVGVVTGGGNLFRGAGLAESGISRIVGDHMGMLATIMNGVAICDALNFAYVSACVMSAIPINGICSNYSWTESVNLLRKNHVVIFTAGTGNPFFTTDAAACLRGIEIEAEVVLKATKVDGVFSADPMKNSDAILYDRLSYQDVLDRNLRVMDLTAFVLARDYRLPIRVFNITKPGALRKVVTGKKEGTLITNVF